MLTYKIFLNTDMTIRDVISSGNLVQYSWNNISVNVYIPKAIYETSPSISNTVSMTFTQTKENGDTVITNNARLYEFSYVKDNVMVNNIEYVLLTRQMPQQMTLYFGNTQKFQINHLVISDNELISFAQSNLYTYEVFQASNTQEIHDEPSTADELQSEINRLKSRVNQVETYKQDKANIDIHVRTDNAVSDDPNHFTTNVTVGLNVLSVRTDDLEIDNKKNKEDIEDIKSTMTSQFTPLGKLDGNTSEPTLEQINAWLSAQGITQLELGDLITYVGHVSGAVDTNYNCLYTKNGWIWYETTSLETASNTEMGIVKGNGNNTNANEVIDIQNGEIQGIKVKNLTGTQRYLKGYINELEDKQDKILDGTTSVPKATNSQNDGLGNNIQFTYQTKVAGASKQYVKDYALAKMFNEMNYINFSTESNTIEPTYSGGTKTLTISNIGDVKLFDAYYKTTAYEYELSQNNVFSISLPIMLNASKTAKIKVVVKCDDNATDTTDTPFVIGTAESDNISFVANQVYKVDIQGTFAPLTQPITITPTKQLVVEVYIFNTDLQAFELNVYNTLAQPSTFTLTIPYQTIQIIEGGAIGQQYLHNVCNYNATATSTLGVGWVFDIDTELVNNTEHKFIARIDEISHQNAFIRVASGGIEIPVIATFETGFESQPYYNQDHRKFIYAVDNNTSIIMFSAFYTNGQFIIVEPNDIDYAPRTDIDDIMNGVLTVGRAKADENGNNIVNTYATKAETENIDKKVSVNINSYTTDKPYAVLNKLGGMSYKSENLLALEDVAQTTVNGITYSVSNGAITLNGTSTNRIQLYFPVKVAKGTISINYFNNFTMSMGLISLNFRDSNQNLLFYINNYPTTNITQTQTITEDIAEIYINIVQGVTFSNTTIKPMLVNGSTAPTTYSQWFKGIRDAIITNVNDLYIPDAIKSLDGYGWGINETCYNYIDFERKVFVQNSDKLIVDNNTVYTYISPNFISCTIQIKNKTTVIGRKVLLYSPIEDNIQSVLIGDSAGNFYISFKTPYESQQALKTALIGSMFVYNLATPIETDISDYIDGKVVKANGNIVFDNEYNYPVPSEFTLTISDNNVLSQNNIGFIKEEILKSSNLLNYNGLNATDFRDNITLTNNFDGSFTLTGNATTNKETYWFLSYNKDWIETNIGKGYRSAIIKSNSNKEMWLGVWTGSVNYNLKPTANITSDYSSGANFVVKMNIVNGETYNITFYPMIVEGDKAPTKFYPYKGNIVHEQDIQNFLPKLKYFKLGGTNFELHFSLQLKYNETITTVAELFNKIATNQPTIHCNGFYWYGNQVYTLMTLQAEDNTSVELQGFNTNATDRNDVYESWSVSSTDVTSFEVDEV